MKKYLFLLIQFVLLSTGGHTAPFSLQFSIPECKIVKEIPFKDRDFAFIYPGQLQTYIYTEEADYYQDYQRSCFAVTCKKGGWDCMRHYEILANGCIPYFLDLDQCDENTMALLPKALIQEAMNLPGVSYLHIDHSKFDLAKYYEILNKLLDYTRKHLTTKNMAKHLLDAVHYSGKGKILYLSNNPDPDYMRCVTLIGLKELLPGRVVDVPKIEHIYQSYSHDIRNLYGKGFSYTKIVEDTPVDRENIEQRIRNREFDLIIYGSVHQGTDHHDLVQDLYSPDKIIYLCGEDQHKCTYKHLPNFFLREFEGN